MAKLNASVQIDLDADNPVAKELVRDLQLSSYFAKGDIPGVVINIAGVDTLMVMRIADLQRLAFWLDAVD